MEPTGSGGTKKGDFESDDPSEAGMDPAESRNLHVLRSWKEIANHLGVTVRTAQRWEQEAGLPVHRPGAEGKVRPFAFAEELERWMRQQEPIRARISSPGNRRYLLWLVPVALALGAGLAWVSYGYLSSAGDPVRWEFIGTTLTTYDESGQVCWTQEFPDLHPDPDWGWDAVQFDTALIRDIDGDGDPETLFNLLPSQGDESRGRLLCFGPRGEMKWEFPLGRKLSYGGRDFSDKYWARFVRLVKGPDREYVLTVALHYRWYPAQVALLDPKNGELVEEYWHPGAFFRMMLNDLDSDGLDEVVLAGVNNPGSGLGHGCLAALKIPFSRQPRAGTGGFWDINAFGEYRYVMFPQSDVATVLGQLPIVQDLEPVEQGLQVSLRFMESGRVYYKLSSEFELMEFGYSDNLLSTHHRAFSEGSLDHELSSEELECLSTVVPFAAVPNGNGAELLRFWKRCETPLSRKH